MQPKRERRNRIRSNPTDDLSAKLEIKSSQQRAYLVVRCNQRADETSNDHDLVNQDGVEDRRPWETSR